MASPLPDPDPEGLSPPPAAAAARDASGPAAAPAAWGPPAPASGLTPWDEHLADLARHRHVKTGDKQISLLSWNVQLLSVSCGTPAELVERAGRIVQVLLAAGPYDVICLQARVT